MCPPNENIKQEMIGQQPSVLIKRFNEPSANILVFKLSLC